MGTLRWCQVGTLVDARTGPHHVAVKYTTLRPSPLVTVGHIPSSVSTLTARLRDKGLREKREAASLPPPVNPHGKMRNIARFTVTTPVPVRVETQGTKQSKQSDFTVHCGAFGTRSSAAGHRRHGRFDSTRLHPAQQWLGCRQRNASSLANHEGRWSICPGRVAAATVSDSAQRARFIPQCGPTLPNH